MDDAIVLDLSRNIVDMSIHLRKTNKIKLPDAIIAASAIVRDKVLIPRNTSDFKYIQRLQVINSYSL